MITQYKHKSMNTLSKLNYICTNMSTSDCIYSITRLDHPNNNKYWNIKKGIIIWEYASNIAYADKEDPYIIIKCSTGYVVAQLINIANSNKVKRKSIESLMLNYIGVNI